jgi:transposase-like protein
MDIGPAGGVTMATKPDKTRLTWRFKPLSPAQETALTLYLAGQSDRDVAQAVGVTRQTCWEWRRQHPVFMAELERRRAEVWRQPQERLRSLLSKAVDNLGQAVESGDLKASIELLKAVGLYGNGTMNAIGEQDPLKVIEAQAAVLIKAEGISEDPTHDMLIQMTQNPAYRRRLDEVKAALATEYLDQL